MLCPILHLVGSSVLTHCQECITDAGDRTGVSRPMIKKFIEERYKMEVTASVISNINRSIAYGAGKGTFVLPKGMLILVDLPFCPSNRVSLLGPSGKVCFLLQSVSTFMPTSLQGQARTQEELI